MSRIYEALQKAEAERKLERDHETGPLRELEQESRPHERDFGIPVTGNGDHHASGAVASAMDHGPVVLPFQETAVAEASPIAAAVPPSSLEEIVRRPWSPSLVQLPALLQR